MLPGAAQAIAHFLRLQPRLSGSYRSEPRSLNRGLKLGPCHSAEIQKHACDSHLRMLGQSSARAEAGEA
jgi:hypothetical protein